jgi:hypothetical protein
MEESYKTTDMALATVLSMKFPIRELISKNGRGTFLFDKSDELEDFVAAFWDKQLSVEPVSLFEALKTIKNRLYNDVKKGQL